MVDRNSPKECVVIIEHDELPWFKTLCCDMVKSSVVLVCAVKSGGLGLCCEESGGIVYAMKPGGVGLGCYEESGGLTLCCAEWWSWWSWSML